MTRADPALSNRGLLPVKIVQYNGQYRITLPKDLVKDKGWDEHMELRFIEDAEGRVYLKPIQSPLRKHSSPRKRGAGRP